MVLLPVQGAVAGSVTVGKVYLADITDATNEARVFSYVGLAMGLGVVTGPTMGGLLARPCAQYPQAAWLDPEGSAVGALFTHYPYLLPCLPAVSFAMANLAGAWILLVESHPTLSRKKAGASGPAEPLLEAAAEPGAGAGAVVPLHVSPLDVELAREPSGTRRPAPLGRGGRSRTLAEPADHLIALDARRQGSLNRSNTFVLRSTPLLDTTINPVYTVDYFRKEDGSVDPSALSLARALGKAVVRRATFRRLDASTGAAAAPAATADAAPELSSVQLRTFCLLQAVQVLFTLTGNGFVEVAPVRMSAPPEHGGYLLSAKAIGATQAVGGGVLLLVVLVIFFRFVKCVGIVRALHTGLASNAVIFLVPLAIDAWQSAHGLAPPAGLVAAFAGAWAIRAFSLNTVRRGAPPRHGRPAEELRRAAAAPQANSCSVLLSKACLPRHLLGLGLGVNQAASSLGNAVGPALSGWLYTLAQDASPHLAPALAAGRLYFIIGCGAALFASALACLLPKWPWSWCAECVGK